MGFFKAQLARLQAYVGGLNASQKMLSAALLTIMLLTLGWLSRYAGTPEMEAVLSQDLDADDLGRMKAALQSKGIPVQVEGSRLLVPADRKIEVLADLGYSDLLPSKMESGFDDIIAKLDSPLNPQSKNDEMWKRVKEQALGRIISHFPRVREAKVMLDSTRQRGFGAANLAPSASVYIQMKNHDRVDKKLVQAAAVIVAGAIAGMEKSGVHVVVDGAPCELLDGDSPGGSDYIERMKVAEQYYADNIRGLLNIEGAMVAVRVKTNNVVSQSTSTRFDKDNVVNSPTHTDSTNKESRSDSRAPSGGGDVGTGPNTSVDLHALGSGGGGAGGESSTTTDSTEKTDNDVRVGQRQETTHNPGGDATLEGGDRCGVPRSYFVHIWQNTEHDQKEPSEAVLRPIIDTELAKLKVHLKALTGLADETKLAVGDYTDFTPSSMASPQAASTPMVMLLNGHMKEMVLGAMVLVSLFLVMRVVKKAAPLPVPASALLAVATAGATAERSGPRNLTATGDVAGEVGEGSPSLDGIEVDPDSVRSQQVVEQVSAMVKENPEAAATLVKRWLNRA